LSPGSDSSTENEKWNDNDKVEKNAKMSILNRPFIYLCDHREEHIEKKIESTVAEAKKKLAKGDKKGKESRTKLRVVYQSLVVCLTHTNY
jgi:hypothetical protein